MHALFPPAMYFASMLFALLLLGRPTGAAEVVDENPLALSVSEPLQRLLTDLARESIPHNYENEKQWGKTTEVVRGLYVKREGWRIKTHRTREEVNHGTWTKYRVQLLDPQQEFQIRLDQVRQLPNGRLAFDVLCEARVRTFGRLAQWQQGVQLMSVCAESDATLELTIACDLATHLDSSTIPPSLAFDPVVREADLRIKDFEMRHISQFDGPLIRALSASVRELLEDEIANRRTKLVTQINRQIDKRRDKLRLSFSELMTPVVESVDPSSSSGHPDSQRLRKNENHSASEEQAERDGSVLPSP